MNEDDILLSPMCIENSGEVNQELENPEEIEDPGEVNQELEDPGEAIRAIIEMMLSGLQKLEESTHLDISKI